MSEEEMQQAIDLAVADADRKGSMLTTSLVANLLFFLLLLFCVVGWV